MPDSVRAKKQKYEEAVAKMQDEARLLSSASSVHVVDWENYCQIRRHNRPVIRKLKSEAKQAYEEAQRLFKLSHEEYKAGDLAKATVHSVEGRKHKDRSDELLLEARKLQEKEDAARQRAKETEPNNTTYKAAKKAMQAAKKEYEDALKEGDASR